ncbi:MAG: hypothetical protein ACYDBB_26080 [Armatimonadota bacterium]
MTKKQKGTPEGVDTTEGAPHFPNRPDQHIITPIIVQSQWGEFITTLGAENVTDDDAPDVVSFRFLDLVLQDHKTGKALKSYVHVSIPVTLHSAPNRDGVLFAFGEKVVFWKFPDDSTNIYLLASDPGAQVMRPFLLPDFGAQFLASLDERNQRASILPPASAHVYHLGGKALSAQDQRRIQHVWQFLQSDAEDIPPVPTDGDQGADGAYNSVVLPLPLAQGRESAKGTPTSRRTLAGFDTVPAIVSPIRFPSHSHINGTLLKTFFSKSEEWQLSEHIGAYYLDTPDGRAIAENVNTLPVLQLVLSLTGAEGLQYTCGAIAAFIGAQREKNGNKLPEYKQCTPVTLHVPQLLRAMGKKSQGKHGGYSREEQLKARKYLRAAGVFSFADITPTRRGAAKIDVGPVIAILNTEAEVRLPLDDESERTDEVISITFMLGQRFYEMVRTGIYWVPPQLLRYHSNNDKYAIVIGFYLANLLMVRRNKDQQDDTVSLGSIEKHARIESFDKRPTVRLAKLEEALHKLVADNVIVGKDGRAVIDDAPNAGGKSTAEAMRDRRLHLIAPPAMLQAMSGGKAIEGQ